MASTSAQPKSATSADVLYREALARLLAECARGLASMKDARPADARAMRQLQQNLSEFVGSESAPGDVQFAAFFVDTIIADAFRNVFGDQIWSEESEASHRRLCILFADFFRDLSAAMAKSGEPAQFECIKNLVIGYLGEIRQLNKIWLGERITRGES
jgi:hypothetical protein